jgi:threonine dehydrogenase-like Zn-dependent dehydrogenase
VRSGGQIGSRSRDTVPFAMRAAFFEAMHRIRVRDAPIPEPGPDEVRLRVRYCGICGSDLTVYKTGVLSGPDVVLGHEVSAAVELDPSGEWAAGARVVPYPGGRGCGRCVWCREGKFRYCLNTPQRHGGGYAEFMTVPKRTLIAIPDGVDDRAAAVAEPLGVGLRGIALAGASAGEFAYVSGLGSIGLFTVAGLVSEGCRVVGADPREDRRAMGLDQGCEAVFDNTAEDPFTRTLSFDEHGPRMAFECSGVPDSLQQVIDACGFEGTIGILGVPMAPVFLLRMMLKEQRAFSIQGPTIDSMRAALALVRDRPHIAKVVTEEVPLESTDDAFSRLVAGDGGIKVLVRPEMKPPRVTAR